MINLHTHCKYCDGNNTPEEMVLSAIEKGFTVLGFSSHCIYPLSSDFYRTPNDDWHLRTKDIRTYTEEINRLKEKYASQIKILLGFEADYFKSQKVGTAIPDKFVYTEFKPDYLIGSVHFVNSEKGFYTVDNSTDTVKNDLIRLYTNPETGNIDGRKAVCEYFQAQREMLTLGHFDIWGHPDLIRKRNDVLKFFDENESYYKEELQLTTKIAAKTGVICEINTGAIARKAMTDTYPSDYFLQLIHDAGIPVCINSDSHSVDTLDTAYDFAIQKAKKAGYTELIYPFCESTFSVKI